MKISAYIFLQFSLSAMVSLNEKNKKRKTSAEIAMQKTITYNARFLTRQKKGAMFIDCLSVIEAEYEIPGTNTTSFQEVAWFIFRIYVK